MTDYNRSEAYDLSLFAEPAIEPTPEPQRRQQPVRQPKPKQAPHSRTAPSASLRRVLGIFAVSIMLIGLFGGIIAMRISLESLTSEAATLRNKISVAERMSGSQCSSARLFQERRLKPTRFRSSVCASSSAIRSTISPTGMARIRWSWRTAKR